MSSKLNKLDYNRIDCVVWVVLSTARLPILAWDIFNKQQITKRGLEAAANPTGIAGGGKTAPHLSIFVLESHPVSFEATAYFASLRDKLG